jgi:hypothetical protein
VKFNFGEKITNLHPLTCPTPAGSACQQSAQKHNARIGQYIISIGFIIYNFYLAKGAQTIHIFQVVCNFVHF